MVTAQQTQPDNRRWYAPPANLHTGAVGQKFAFLTVEKHVPEFGFVIRCDCGRSFWKSSTMHIRNGRLKSCGKCNLTGRKRWTPAEDAIISKHAGTLTATKIAAQLEERTASQVTHRAKRLKISLKTHGDNCSWSKYSDHDCELARQLHDEGMAVKLISEKLEIPFHALTSIIYHKRR